MSSSHNDFSMAELIERGRHLVEAKKYNRALDLFFLASSFNNGKCDNVHHIEALDSRAAAFEAMGELDSATDDAEWILELAPQLPDGYLRLGNTEKLQGNSDFAWEIYTMGIEAVKETSMEFSPKLQVRWRNPRSTTLRGIMTRPSMISNRSRFKQLYDARTSVNRHVLRRDLLCLPADLCLRVSKKWTRTLTSPLNARLWRDMQFSDWCVTPGPEALKRMLSWAGDSGARKIVIPEDMNLTQSMLTLLLDESPYLEYLKIEDLPGEISFPTNGKTWNRLKHFSLEGGNYGCFFAGLVDDPGGFPRSFLQDAAGSLEHLDFVGIPAEWFISEMASIPFLPKLKTLRINETETSYGDETGLSFPIYPLSVAFPRLEQLCIGPNIPHFDPEPVSMWRDKREDIWPHLKVLIFAMKHVGDSSLDTAMTHSALWCLMCSNRGNSLQHVRLEIRCGPYARPDTDVFSAGDDLLPNFDFVQDTESKNLRSFKTTSLSILPDRARNLLSKALQTKQLTSFDIVFPKYYNCGSRLYSSVDEYVEGRHADHLRGYDWARGAPSIQSLSCYGLRLHPPPKNDQDHLVADFLATFPNLRILSIDCEFDDMADYVSLLVEILRHTHLETMYMRRVDHEACAQLRQAARDQGVQLKKLPGRFTFHWPPQREWPVSLGPGGVGG
ncbi:hypothetical protein E4U11_000891 [Claviceps purpurea]|nr:hypothetical protein E4U11_000891 [Claviceps purpurea]